MLLLKTPHTLALGHREINLELTRKLSTCWLAFTGLGGAAKAADKKRKSHPGLDPECYRMDLLGKMGLLFMGVTHCSFDCICDLLLRNDFLLPSMIRNHG